MVWTVGREGREIKHMDRSVLSRSLATPGIDALFFVPVGGSNRDKRPKSRLEPPTGMKRYFFVPVGGSNRDKRPLTLLLPG